MKKLHKHAAAAVYAIYVCVFPLYSESNTASGLCISEIMFNPAGPEQSDEFIELYNCSSDTVCLAGWSISDGTGSDLIADAGMGLLLPPRTFCLVTDPDYAQIHGIETPATSMSCIVVTIDGATFGSRGLSNSCAETVSLISNTGETISSAGYDTSVPEGFSWEKIILCGNHPSGNWAASKVHGGTPGSQNSASVKAAASCSIQIAPNPFSPNGDGLEDYTSVSYDLSLYNPLVSVMIFDLNGRCIHTLLNTYNSPPRHTVVWDGTTRHGSHADTGLYIIFLTAVDACAGEKVSLQACVAVSQK